MNKYTPNGGIQYNPSPLRHGGNLRHQITQFFTNAFDIVLPPRCIQCRSMGEAFCTKCREQVEWMRGPLCLKCGRSWVFSDVCDLCQAQELPLIQIRAAVCFCPPMPQIIHAFKYRHVFALAKPCGLLMAQAWPQWQTAVDVVVPIPLHRDRWRERGYNQSALLARQFSRHTGLCVDTQAMRRIRQTESQARLTATKRRQNVQGAFTADRAHVAGKRILLIDDVCTTGATLSAATDALLEAGGISVAAYCLARA